MEDASRQYQAQKEQNQKVEQLKQSFNHFQFKTLADCVDENVKQLHGRSPAHTNFDDGPFKLLKSKETYDPYLKIDVRDMKYERVKWCTLHDSMLKKQSRGLERHKRKNLYKSVYCNQTDIDEPPI